MCVGMQVMARYLWEHLTPWLEEDVRVALERPDVQALRQKPYVGFHIRRGDKVSTGEADKMETKVRRVYVPKDKVTWTRDYRRCS